jgi:hypothetical protein
LRRCVAKTRHLNLNVHSTPKKSGALSMASGLSQGLHQEVILTKGVTAIRFVPALIK